jgi:hypothetical protein
MDPDPTPDPTPFFSDFKNAQKINFFLHTFFLELTRRHPIFSLSSVMDPHQIERGDPDP